MFITKTQEEYEKKLIEQKIFEILIDYFELFFSYYDLENLFFYN